MSTAVKKTKAVRVKKAEVAEPFRKVEVPEPVVKAEPKVRKSRAKAKPTKEELLKMLLDSSNEIKQIIVDLKEDECKIVKMCLKRVPEQLKETISNMEEDQKEIDEKYQELLTLPDETPQI